MAKLPAISVIIPVYNRETLVAASIESVLEQTFSDFELIITDNASTDASLRICETFASDPRVRILRQPVNVGPVQNWVRGLEAARAPLAKILFSDDLMRSDCLDKMFRRLGDDVGLVFSAARIGPEPWQGTTEYRCSSETFTRAEFLRLAMLTDRLPFSPAACLVRTQDALDALRQEIRSPSFGDFLQHGAGPDFLIYLVSAHRRPYSAHVPEELVFFRAHAGSISIAKGRLFVLDRYAQARVHFAATHGYASLIPDVLTVGWLTRLASGEPMGWTTYVRRFTSAKVGFRPRHLLRLARRVS